MGLCLRFRLVGVQQSWGTRSRFDVRDTEVAPTKSGVLGLVAAALGIPRSGDITHLAQLRMGVRTDRRGLWRTDYHTALDVVSSEGKVGDNAVVSTRAYLADAAFLVGLEGEDRVLLSDIQAALLNPRWPLGLGRRSFPPSLPIAFSGTEDPQPLVEGMLEEALANCPLIVGTAVEKSLVYHIEDQEGDQEWFDQPVGTFSDRRFRIRRVRVREAKWGTKCT